ncbi:DNA polymerase IV, partial [Planococcus sp. SIMBA_160]
LDGSVRMTVLLAQYSVFVEPSSMDEQFLDITGSLTLLGSPREIAENIQTTIMNQTGIYARIGIGPNKVLAKMACDHFAKQNTSSIYELRADRVAAD